MSDTASDFDVARADTVGDVIAERLRTWGVPRVFGYSGDGVNGLLAALARSGTPFVQARHEENAAFMAVGHAKYAGGVGVCVSTQGPGAVHLLNGLYDAKLDRVPVVALVGQQHTTVLGSGYMQELDLRVLFADVAAHYVVQVASPEQVPMAIDRAFRTAIATQSPTVVIVPADLQTADAPELPQEHGIVVTAPGAERARPALDHDRIHAAAELLAEAERPALLVGRGALGARAAVHELAERLGAGITTSLLGKPAVDESHPLAAGVMGHLGSTASADVLAACDALVIIGSNDPWTEFYPAPGHARAVQIDIDPLALGNRYPIEVAVAGDADEAVRALIAALGDGQCDRADAAGTTDARRSPWVDRVLDAVTRWRTVAAQRAELPMEGVNPEAAMRALNPHLPADAAVALDVGSVVYWYARQLRLAPAVPAHVSGTLASMGCGVPYGIAAKLAASDRPVVVLAGDGGMQMTGIAELVTVAARWRDWADPRFVIAVWNNRDLAEVSWEQRENVGVPRIRETQALPDVPFAALARVLGIDGERVTADDDLDAAWARAFAADRPYVLDLMTDPAAPMLPPLAQAGEKLEPMRRALDAEIGEAEGSDAADARRARRLLDAYAAMEPRD